MPSPPASTTSSRPSPTPQATPPRHPRPSTRSRRSLGNLGDKTDNADLGKAVDNLQAGVGNVRDSIEKGDATPDIKPVTDAAAEIGKVCTP